MSISSCPGPQVLQNYVLGRLDEAGAEGIERHLAGCDRCLRLLQDLPSDDELARSVHAQANAKDLPDQEAAEQLAERLCKMEGFLSGPSPADTESGPQTVSQPGPSSGQQDQFDFLDPPQNSDELGRLASYRILKVLGQGGMGIVFLAEDPSLHRMVALKTLKSAAANDVNRKRFLREAQATAAIEHDHIVPIYQVGESRGVPFLAMQMLKGETLEQRLKREKRLPPSEIFRIGREIASGLSAAHQHGLVHRDIKPSNIWLEAVDSEQPAVGSEDNANASLPAGHCPLTRGGRVKIVDFGLARAASDEESLTESGFVVGTPAYMAPEQARGQAVDARCDMFSLGCVLYRMSTGKVPFHAGDTLATLLAVATESPPAPSAVNPDVPPGLSALVMRLLAKNPTERPSDARSVIAALQAIERGDVEPAPGKRHRVRRVLAGFALGAVVVTIPWLGGLFSRPIANTTGNSTQLAEATSPTRSAPTLPAPPPPTSPEPVKPPPEPDPDPDPPPPAGKQGRALSAALALVSAPAPRPGLQGWTLETRGHRGPVRALAHCPDDTTLATAGADGTIRLWDQRTGKLRRILVGHNYMVDGLAWSADGTVLASRAGDGTVRLWEAATGKGRLPLRLGSPTAFALSPDAQMVATAGSERCVRLWDTAGKLVGVVDGLSAEVAAIAWSPDGTTLAAGGRDGAIFLSDRQGRQSANMPGHKEAVIAVAFSPDGKFLVSASRDQSLRLWDVAHQEMVRVYPWQPKSKGAGPGVGLLSWPARGKLFASIHADGVQLWDPVLNQTTPIRTISVNGRAVSLSADGSTVATVGPEPETVQVWSAGNGKLSFSLPVFKEEKVSGISWSPDGAWFAMWTEGTVHLWEAATGRLARSLPAHSREVTGLAWSPDGKVLATTGGWNSKLLVHDVATGKVLHTVDCKADYLGHASWSPDGAFLAIAADRPREALVWKADGGKPDFTKPPRAVTGFGSSVTGLAWSNGVLAMSSADAAVGVKFWDAAAGKDSRPPILAYLKPNGPTLAVAWSPDGRFIATGGSDTAFPVRIFETSSGKRANEMKGQEGRVQGLTWLADGNTVISRTDDGTLRFFDTSSGHLTRRVGGRPGVWNFLPERGLLQNGCHSYAVRFRQIDDNRPHAALVLLRRAQTSLALTVTPEGHYHSSQQLEAELMYVVQTEQGQQLLSPTQFSLAYDWKNDPHAVRLVQSPTPR
jgi:eukaryotic-like serine/threonine-protein kinase